jgi:hypothetical protein
VYRWCGSDRNVFSGKARAFPELKILIATADRLTCFRNTVVKKTRVLRRLGRGFNVSLHRTRESG